MTGACTTRPRPATTSRWPISPARSASPRRRCRTRSAGPTSCRPSSGTGCSRPRGRPATPGPHPVARMLNTRRAGAVGLILPESLPFALDDPVASELIRGIADACEERRLGLLVVPGGLHAADTRLIGGVAVDGFVAYSLPHGSSRLEAALGRGVPIVVVDQPRLPGVATVGRRRRGGRARGRPPPARARPSAVRHRDPAVPPRRLHGPGRRGAGRLERVRRHGRAVRRLRGRPRRGRHRHRAASRSSSAPTATRRSGRQAGALPVRAGGPPDGGPGDERPPRDRRHGRGPRGGARRSRATSR